jgi:hypothetical protein
MLLEEEKRNLLRSKVSWCMEVKAAVGQQTRPSFHVDYV